MSDSSKAFFVTSVSNGHVLANRADGRPSGVVAENKSDQGDAEKWTIEASDEPNKVALKNAANGQYLHANGNKCWATVGTGEKQWWKISSDGVTAPGACRLSPVEYPDVYLNHFQGKAVRKGQVGMKVHMWTWTPEHESWFTWYFLDTNISFNPLTSGTSAGETSKADADAKSSQERDNARAEEDKTRSAEWDKKMKDLQDRQAASATEEEKRTADYDQKLKDLQARGDALSQREEQATSSKDNSDKDSSKQDDQAQRESDIQRRLDDLSSAEQKLASGRAALQKSQSDLEKRDKDITQREKTLSSSEEASTTPKTNGSTTNGTNDSAKSNSSDKSAEQRLEKTRQDNANLEQRLAKLEDQLANMSKSSGKASDSKPQPNGKANTSTPSKSDASSPSPGCGYKHYKPPRKLNKKLIGMIYE